jgi:hypothetical protein
MRYNVARRLRRALTGSRCAGAIIFACLLLATAACSSAGLSTPSASATPVPQFADLPAPSEVVKRGQYTDAFRTRLGSQFLYMGYGYEDYVDVNGDNCTFAPVWGSVSPPSIREAARAGFQFNVADYAGPPNINFGWVTPPDHNLLWVGVANRNKDRWDWYQSDGARIVLPGMADYNWPSGVFIVVVLLGEAPAELGWVRLGPVMWNVEVVDAPGGGDVGSFSSLALNIADLPRIAYYDAGNTALKYALYDGATWDISTVDDTADCGMYASLALDSSGAPRIAYMDNTSADLKYASFNGSTWDFETLAAADSSGYSCTLALDSLERPCIAYYNASTTRITYTHYDGAVWQESQVGPGNPVTVYISMVLDATDMPHLTYVNGADQVYAYYDGAIWHTENVSTGMNHGSDGERALVFDSLGDAHVMTYGLIDGFMYYASRSAGVWTEQQVPALQNVGTNGSLALNSADEPMYTCYGAGLEFITLSGASWSNVTVDDGWVGHDTSLVLDSQGLPCVSYRDATNQSLRFARGILPD